MLLFEGFFFFFFDRLLWLSALFIFLFLCILHCTISFPASLATRHDYYSQVQKKVSHFPACDAARLDVGLACTIDSCAVFVYR